MNKDLLVEVLMDIRGLLRDLRDGQERLEVATVEAARSVEELRTSVMDQSARQQEQLARHQKRITEHDVRLFHLEEVQTNGAGE